MALISKKRRDLPSAAQQYQEVVRVRRQAFEADPKNTRYWALLASGVVYLANTYSAQGRHEEAIRLCREAVSMGRLVSDPPYRLLWQVEHSRVALVHALADADLAAALEQRATLRAAAENELRLVKTFIDRTPDRNLSPSDRSLRADYGSARAELEALRKQAGTPRP